MKPASQRTRPRIGDVIEIGTPKGLAYAQYTHKHDEQPRYGALIRVLPGLYKTRPVSFNDLVKRKERFFVFFPLGAACKRGIVTIVANEVIPKSACPFPTFRSRATERPSWELWDGHRYWCVYKLTPEQRSLPILAVWNDTLLIDRIVQGWSPADER
ncbi:MAG: hypothetical protein A2Y78_15400 [Acidobacteria bacterium RBG_13_68_16]|nr:MAG: hypothetical protein A2Y78_15400 [Acidobacteria bacterium RBG_13_68_16]